MVLRINDKGEVISPTGKTLKVYQYADGTPYVNTAEGRLTLSDIMKKQINRVGGHFKFHNGDKTDFSLGNTEWFSESKPRPDMRGKSNHLGGVTGLSVYSRRRVVFPTLERAALFAGKSQSAISRAIKFKRPCGGYDWFFSGGLNGKK